MTSPSSALFTLSIERLAIPVHLGAGEEERSEQQTVFVSVDMFYPAAPEPTRQDAADYLCYDTLCQKLLAEAAKRPIHLIEFLSAELLKVVRESVPAEVSIRLKLQKPLPVSLVGYQVAGAAVELFDAGRAA